MYQQFLNTTLRKPEKQINLFMVSKETEKV